ncbi:MAG: ATP-binding protein [Clostridia bacterium]|nr:ATP-binding protein [Clostridia bacterium]
MARYLKRKIDNYLECWKANPDHLPLIIKGARQVGKTASIEHFASMNYKSIIEINFATMPEYRQIVDNGYTVPNVIKAISRINSKARFIDHATLFIFDEIQAFPDITTTLKCFAIDGRYDVICSGSLLGVHYHSISSISVGYKDEVEMKSMDFDEFLWALGYDNSIRDDMLEHMRTFRPFSDVALKHYDDIFTDYCITGGMPQIVSNFVQKGTFEETLKLQKLIVVGYEDDIKKYSAGLDKGRIEAVFRNIPSQLGKVNKKFQVSKLKKTATFEDYSGAFDWLLDAGIINVSHALNPLELPLSGNCLPGICVFYYADSGLLLSQLDEESQKDFKVNKNLGTYKGGLFECIIGEALIKAGYDKLYYYKKENSPLQEEFIVRSGNRIVPIEVKAQNNQSKSLATLINSQDYKEITYGMKFIRGNIGYENNIITFPHFCAFLTKEFLSGFTPN